VPLLGSLVFIPRTSLLIYDAYMRLICTKPNLGPTLCNPANELDRSLLRSLIDEEMGRGLPQARFARPRFLESTPKKPFDLETADGKLSRARHEAQF